MENCDRTQLFPRSGWKGRSAAAAGCVAEERVWEVPGRWGKWAHIEGGLRGSGGEGRDTGRPQGRCGGRGPWRRSDLHKFRGRDFAGC